MALIFGRSLHRRLLALSPHARLAFFTTRARRAIDWGVALFMMSYILVTNWTLLQARMGDCGGGFIHGC